MASRVLSSCFVCSRPCETCFTRGEGSGSSPKARTLATHKKQSTRNVFWEDLLDFELWAVGSNDIGPTFVCVLRTNLFITSIGRQIFLLAHRPNRGRPPVGELLAQSYKQPFPCFVIIFWASMDVHGRWPMSQAMSMNANVCLSLNTTYGAHRSNMSIITRRCDLDSTPLQHPFYSRQCASREVIFILIKRNDSCRTPTNNFPMSEL